MNSGIYAIINKANNKFYLGSAKDFDKRWKGHLDLLVINNHHSKHLQNAWNHYGEDYFDFVILEEVPIENLIKEEQSYLDNLRPWDSAIGYNISKDAFAPTRGRKIILSTEAAEKKRTRMLGNTTTLGYHHTDETRELMSQLKKGIPPSQKALEASREVHIKTWPGLIAPDGTIYESITNLNDFCKEHDINYGNIQAVYKGTRGQCLGWRALENKYTQKIRSDKGKERLTKPINCRIWEGTLISPEGEIFTNIFNLKNFCKEHSVNYTAISRLFKGSEFEYKGWSVYLPDEEILPKKVFGAKKAKEKRGSKEDDRKRISKAMSERVVSIETRQRMSESHIGKPPSEKVIQKTIERLSKTWKGIIISPEGEQFVDIFNLKDFCSNHNIDYSGMRRLLSGKQTNYKGWTVC